MAVNEAARQFITDEHTRLIHRWESLAQAFAQLANEATEFELSDHLTTLQIGTAAHLPTDVLLALAERTCEDFLIANGAGGPNVPPWYALGYYRDGHMGEGEWEIDVTGSTMRDVLEAFIADPRFGQ